MLRISGFTRLIISILSISAIYSEASRTGLPYILERTSEFPVCIRTDSDLASHLKPGGYIEQFEVSVGMKSDDGTVTDDSPLKIFNDLCEVSKISYLHLILPRVSYR